MHHSLGHGPAVEVLRRRAIVSVLLVMAVAAGLWAIGPARGPTGRRLAVGTADRDTRPGVGYVGDQACTHCHAGIAATYRRHSMGRSLTPIESAPSTVQGAEGDRGLFEAQGFLYSVAHRDGRTFHRQTRRDRQGKVVAQVEREVRFVLGSGSRGLSFLVDCDGYLFQSPITWYAQKQRWDLSPGYENFTDRFERPINPECLFCHANQVEHVAGTESRYRPPTFRGHAIGCERCHGPGEQHVSQPVAPAGTGPNIVNPVKLEPALRESVCQQCHLIGKERVAPVDHDLFEYRPGLPLHRFVTVLVRPPGLGEDHHNGDQVEQMYRSRCFRASRGRLGCISCHDPHRLPAPEEKVAYYRGRCLECHSERGCGLAPAARLARSPADDCMGCHMPRAPITDISHTTMTVHSIPRHRDDGALHPDNGSPPAEDSDLVPFHRDLMSPEELRGARRDLGVVLGQMRGGRGAARALPLLEEALASRPDDLQASEALGYALGSLKGRESDGLASFEAALRLAPNRESTLAGAALLAGRLQLRDQSVAYWRRAVAVDPWRAFYRATLAHQLARSGRWDEAAQACHDALRVNPINLLARTILIECAFQGGSPHQARAELDTLLEFDPPNREALMRWFASLR